MQDFNDNEKKRAFEWFKTLRDKICSEFVKIELEYSGTEPIFKRTKWDYKSGTGGGEITIIHGAVFEKVGVNISMLSGTFSEKYALEIPGTKESGNKFWASGISLVSHMQSPLVPAAHMNTRHIRTSTGWFGGGMDLTPYAENKEDYNYFHESVKNMCMKHNPTYYDDFKDQCDKYFFLHHRNEPRGIGGIFYDYMNTDWESDFSFTQSVGECFNEVYPEIIRRNMNKKWSEEDRELQLIKRGRYVEFNLLYDRGTKFGLETGGNTDGILMSMPPIVKWPA